MRKWPVPKEPASCSTCVWGVIMIKVTIVSTKGGVGKTTLTANLGALLADLGIRVLMIDADVQPTLSSYYSVIHPAPSGPEGWPQGLTKLVHDAAISSDIISHTAIENLDIIVSDDPQVKLPNWILHTADGRVRIKYALMGIEDAEIYDVVLIDTQGAIGPLQDAAVLAADFLLSPVPPEILSAREFLRGTAGELYKRLQPMERLLVANNLRHTQRPLASRATESSNNLRFPRCVRQRTYNIPHAADNSPHGRS